MWLVGGSLLTSSERFPIIKGKPEGRFPREGDKNLPLIKGEIIGVKSLISEYIYFTLVARYIVVPSRQTTNSATPSCFIWSIAALRSAGLSMGI